MKPLLVVLVTLTAGMNTAQAAADCDRECLSGFVTRYLDAMVAHNPSTLPVSDKLKFTEDTVQMRLGYGGLWKGATRLGAHRQDILDVREGVAASQVIVEEAAEGQSHPVMLVLRLKVADRKITEVETQVTRSQKEGAIFNVGAIQAASKAMNAAPERSQLASRADAIKLAEFYPAGLKVGSFIAVDAPFAPDAYRIENGTITAGPGCGRAGCENIKAQTIIKHPAITTRIAAVDEEMGVVLLRMNFGDTGAYGPGNALIVWEAFKVFGGQIHAVEAFMRVMPASAGSGWD